MCLQLIFPLEELKGKNIIVNTYINTSLTLISSILDTIVDIRPTGLFVLSHFFILTVECLINWASANQGSFKSADLVSVSNDLMCLDSLEDKKHLKTDVC